MIVPIIIIHCSVCWHRWFPTASYRSTAADQNITKTEEQAPCFPHKLTKQGSERLIKTKPSKYVFVHCMWTRYVSSNQMMYTSTIWTLIQTQIIVHSTTEQTTTLWSDHRPFHQSLQCHVVVRSSCRPSVSTVSRGGQIIQCHVVVRSSCRPSVIVVPPGGQIIQCHVVVRL